MLQYYLKARFHFNKQQFADLMMISGIAGTISQVLLDYLLAFLSLCFLFLLPFNLYMKMEAILQLVLMPILAPSIREEKLLSLGLLFSFSHVSGSPLYM